MMENKQKGAASVSTIKIAVWYIVGNFFAKGVAMLSTPLFTRIMSKKEYGEFSNFTSWESILMILATLDFSTSITRAKYDYNDKINEYLSSILVFGNLFTMFLYFIVELYQDFFIKLFSMDLLYIRLLFLYLLFEPAFSYLQIKHRIYQKYKFFVVYSISSTMIRTGISVILVLLLKNKLFGRICGYVIPVTFCNIVLWIAVLTEGRKLSWEYVKYGCRISIPLIPHALSGIVLAHSDRIMIRHYCGSEATAVYSLGYTVSTIASLLWTSMNQAWAPWLYDQLYNGNKKTIIKNSAGYLGIFVFLIIAVFLTAPEMIWLFGGKQYCNAKYLVPPVILACVLQFIYSMYVNIEIYAKKTFTISIGTMGAAVLNLFLNDLFIPRYGYAAAVFTTVAGYFALLIFHCGIVKICIKELSSIYNIKFITIMLVLVVLFCGISFVLYRYQIIRYILILVYVLFAVAVGCKYRKRIEKLFHD